jgi:hypothetical protein
MYVYMESTDVKNCQGTKTRMIDEDDRVQDGDEKGKKGKIHNFNNDRARCMLRDSYWSGALKCHVFDEITVLSSFK